MYPTRRISEVLVNTGNDINPPIDTAVVLFDKENLYHNERTSNRGNDCSTTSGDVDKYNYAFSSDIQDDRDDNGDQSNIHLGNIVESIVSTDDDVSLCSLTVCIFGINRIIIPIGN